MDVQGAPFRRFVTPQNTHHIFDIPAWWRPRFDLMNLFSILIADHPKSSGSAFELPAAVARNIESFKAWHPGASHRLYDKESLRDFLRSSMGKDVLWAFDQFLPYAYKADLARLCLLHEFGGVYADLSVHFHGSWEVRPGKLSVFRDRAHVAPWIVSNTIISAPPRFPALEAAIRMILAHCRARYRGHSSLCPTGPVLFGKAIAMHCDPGQIHMGEATNAAARDTVEALVFIDTTDGRLVGYRAKTRAGLSELGLHAGVNNYNDFHRRGVIYASDFPVTIPAAYLHKNGHTRCPLNGNGIEYRSQSDGGIPGNTVVLGNFLPFCPGSYVAHVDVSTVSPGSKLTLLLTALEDKKELARTAIVAEGSATTMAARFHLALSRNDIVLVVQAANCAHLVITQLRIEMLPDAACQSAEHRMNDLPAEVGSRAN